MPIVELGFKGSLALPALSSTEPLMPGRKKAFIFAQNSGGRRRTGQGSFKRPADEFRLGGAGFRQTRFAWVRAVAFAPRGGGEETVAANYFTKNACLGDGQPEFCG